MAEWIAEIRISAYVGAKVREKHQLTGDMVRDAIGMGRMVDGRWDFHELHGWRLLVIGTLDSGRRIKVVLASVDDNDGIWRCKTAFPQR